MNANKSSWNSRRKRYIHILFLRLMKNCNKSLWRKQGFLVQAVRTSLLNFLIMIIGLRFMISISLLRTIARGAKSFSLHGMSFIWKCTMGCKVELGKPHLFLPSILVFKFMWDGDNQQCPYDVALVEPLSYRWWWTLIEWDWCS